MLVQGESGGYIGVFVYGAETYTYVGGTTTDYGKTDWTNPSQISWYGTIGTQFNDSQKKYRYVLFSTDKIPSFERIFTENTTYTVPVTRNYYLELYGIGGKSRYNEISGRSSCSSYTISLTKGQQIPVKIAKFEVAGQDAFKLIEPATNFGNYSVENAAQYGAEQPWHPNTFSATEGIKGKGNLGTDGVSGRTNDNYCKRVLNKDYGYGLSIQKNGPFGGPRAIYLKFLGKEN